MQKQDRRPNQYTQFAVFKPSTQGTETLEDEELEGMTLEEALAKIEDIMKEVRQLEQMKKRVLSNKTMTDTSKKLRCRPINEKMKEFKKEMRKYEKVRAKHLGILDKIPKDHPLYGYHTTCQLANKMKEVALEKIDEERNCLNQFLGNQNA